MMTPHDRTVGDATPLFCPGCGNALRATHAKHVDELPTTPLMRRRLYECSDCGKEYYSTEWLDVLTDDMVYHLSEIMRSFAHPLVAANLGGVAYDIDADKRGRVVMKRWTDSGTVDEYEGVYVRALWAILRDRQAVKLQRTQSATRISRPIERYDLPIRLVREDQDVWAVPAGAWHAGQVYGAPDDPRYARITFGLVEAKR